MPPEYVHVLRTCRADMTAYGGFRWPGSGPVEAPDWSADGECGGGLHGLLKGEGDAALLDWSLDAKWLVVRVAAADVRDLGGKVKFPRGDVVYAGDRHAATQMMAALHPEARAVVGMTLTGGNYATLTGGDYATLTGGHSATLVFYWRDADRRRVSTAHVGENGIKPNVAYRCAHGVVQEGK